MRIVLFFSVILMVSGCVQKKSEPLVVNCLPSNSISVRYYPNPETDMSQSAYVSKIGQIISSRIYGASAYKGQRCTVRLNARNKIATAERGDMTLCMALLYAVSSTAFPTVPEGIHEKDPNALMSIPVDVSL
ncbi:hypothetical protein FKH18_24060 [Salmonella enterica]|uniref:Lipoprotein n=2 Tax=Salmonella enterica TaxID=28901 RepID=A0A619I1I0_SALER|nr:hypothetical protein [Salmonella enterica]ECF1924134.1 hypothetical protein [Salmonella enterica subsp. enterica serovar Newport]ECJ2363466.1 hypothetical protein [Salmonella enterica subsp. diarizonae]ECW2470132.1 hypothetical protein [Salmonella enterica subsp. enterica serovar Java]EAV7629452.1 hypothetical protein [Salmonella enterica]